jgi:GT2 family glycosyltransferase
VSGESVLVVLPTLGDRLETLRETLESVDDQRKDVDLTLVVVAPARATAASEMAMSYGAVVVDDPGLGISNAINRGIAAATNETYYAWIGDDDLFRPRGLSTLRRLFADCPSAVLAYGACDYIDPAGQLLFTNRAGKLARWLLPWGPDLIPHPGSMLRLDAMRTAGLFDVDLRYAMDLDLFLRLRKLGRFVCTKESVSAFRWHPASLTVAGRSASTAEAEAVKRRHLPAYVRPFASLWNIPIRIAAQHAARSLNRRAQV